MRAWSHLWVMESLEGWRALEVYQLRAGGYLWVRGVTDGSGGALVRLGGICESDRSLVGLDAPLWARRVTCGARGALMIQGGQLWDQESLGGLRGHLWVGETCLAQEVPCRAGAPLVELPPPVTCRSPRPSAGRLPLHAAMPPPSHKGTPSVGYPRPQISGVCPCTSPKCP